MSGHKDGQGAAACSTKRTPDERTDGGGSSGKRSKKVRAADGTSTTSDQAAARVPNPPAPKKRIHHLCEHNRRRNQCKDCGGSGICEHQRVRSTCEDCGGGGLCEHQRQRSQCKDCGGSGLCEHQRRRSKCQDCRTARSKAYTHERVVNGEGAGAEGTPAPAAKRGVGRPRKRDPVSPDFRKSRSQSQGKQLHTESQGGGEGSSAEKKRKKDKPTHVCGQRTLPRRVVAGQPKVHAHGSAALGEEEAFVGEGEEQELQGMQKTEVMRRKRGKEDVATARKNAGKERVHERDSTSSSAVAGSGVEDGVNVGLEESLQVVSRSGASRNSGAGSSSSKGPQVATASDSGQRPAKIDTHAACYPSAASAAPSAATAETSRRDVLVKQLLLLRKNSRMRKALANSVQGTSEAV